MKKKSNTTTKKNLGVDDVNLKILQINKYSKKWWITKLSKIFYCDKKNLRESILHMSD